MAKENNLTEKFVKATEINFVNEFGRSIGLLKEALGITKEMKLPIGSTIKTYKSKVTLENGAVEKGDIIPLSKVETDVAETYELAWKKFRKGVAIEDVQTYGFKKAVTDTDAELVKEVQKDVRKGFLDFIKKGTGKAEGVGLQKAAAKAWGIVQTKFEDDAVNVVGFINSEDLADYLGGAEITMQTAFGLKYIKNFLNLDVVIVSPLIEKGTMYATAANNLRLAYADMSGGEAAGAFGLYTDDTGLLGITHDIAKNRLQSETIIAEALVFFAERLDGVVKSTIQAGLVA